MADTIRESIIAAIETAMADIRKSSGYETDAGQSVNRGKWVTASTPLPAMSIMPLEEINEPIPGRHNLTMRVRVDGISEFLEKRNPSENAEKLLGDIIKRMTNPGLTAVHGGYGDKVQYSEGGIEEYPEPGHKTIACYAIFDVSYKTNLGDPFNQ